MGLERPAGALTGHTQILAMLGKDESPVLLRNRV